MTILIALGLGPNQLNGVRKGGTQVLTEWLKL